MGRDDSLHEVLTCTELDCTSHRTSEDKRCPNTLQSPALPSSPHTHLAPAILEKEKLEGIGSDSRKGGLSMMGHFFSSGADPRGCRRDSFSGEDLTFS